MLAFNLNSAMRVLSTIAVVLVSLSRSKAHETGSESVISALMAGAAAVAFWLLFWLPSPAPRCWQLLAMAFLGLWWFREPSAIGVRARSRWRSPWSGWVLDRGGQHLVEDARLVPLLDHERALRGLGAR